MGQKGSIVIPLFLIFTTLASLTATLEIKTKRLSDFFNSQIGKQNEINQEKINPPSMLKSDELNASVSPSTSPLPKSPSLVTPFPAPSPKPETIVEAIEDSFIEPTPPPKKAPIDHEETSNNILDIVILSNGYSNSDEDKKNFEEDFKAYTDYFFTIEALKSRKADIVFKPVWNTVDLKIQVDGNSAFTTLAPFQIFKIVDNAGFKGKYNLVGIISSNCGVKGTAGFPPVTCNNRGNNKDTSITDNYARFVFVHEMSHYIFGLLDEYVTVTAKGIEDGKISSNCYHGDGSGKPTKSVWPGTDPNDYQLGCHYPNWWRPSSSSIMKGGFAKREFNKPSQNIINNWLDYYTGKQTYDEIKIKNNQVYYLDEYSY